MVSACLPRARWPFIAAHVDVEAETFTDIASKLRQGSPMGYPDFGTHIRACHGA